jgi:hypothetical protein
VQSGLARWGEGVRAAEGSKAPADRAGAMVPESKARGSEGVVVVGEDCVGLDRFGQVRESQACGATCTETWSVARDTGKPGKRDEDESVEARGEGTEERVGRGGAGCDEGEVTAVGRERAEDGASLGPRARAGQASEEAVRVETEDVDVVRSAEEDEEAVVHSRVSWAARRT